MMEGYTFYTDEQVENMGVVDMVGAVEAWAYDRNLDTAEPAKQLLKLYEEVGEIADAKVGKDSEEFKDALGDTLVVLTVLSTQLFDKESYRPVLDGLQWGYNTTISALDKDEKVLMLLKSLGEISSVIARNQGELSSDELQAIARSIVVAVLAMEEIALSNDFQATLLDSYKYAYNVIKHRKGKLIDGVFVKEDDLNG